MEYHEPIVISHLTRYCMIQEKECRVVIESDEEIDGAFSCLLEETKTGS